MKAIVRKRQTRKLVETDKKPLHFEIRGNSVEPKKVDGWMKRENVQESILYHPSPAAGKWALDISLVGRPSNIVKTHHPRYVVGQRTRLQVLQAR